jgi:hypothetical protein
MCASFVLTQEYHTLVQKMRKSEKVLTIRLPDLELDKLEKYCCENKRTKTDVIREFIRSLDVAHK